MLMFGLSDLKFWVNSRVIIGWLEYEGEVIKCVFKDILV